jgi:hypothetical protein
LSDASQERFIEEEHAMMSQADLAGARRAGDDLIIRWRLETG